MNVSSISEDQYEFIKKQLLPSYKPEDLSESELKETLEEYKSNDF